MKYINKKLTIERVSVQAIANKYNTPTYCYSFNKLKENIVATAKASQYHLGALRLRDLLKMYRSAMLTLPPSML